MLRFMLDTNPCIRVLRDRPAELRERFNREAEGLCISSIILNELLYGAGKSARPAHHWREVDRFAARLAVLNFDAEAAASAEVIRFAQGSAGQEECSNVKSGGWDNVRWNILNQRSGGLQLQHHSRSNAVG
jgi:tRNA(fMet)-specific endonuclease VapC